MKCGMTPPREKKTEFMMFGIPQDLEKVTAWTVTVGDTEILPSPTTCNIGAFLDVEMNMRCQLNNTLRACYYQLHSLGQIRRHLSEDAAVKLCHAFITSRINNMNSLLYKIPDYRLARLQMVLNNTARLIKQIKKIITTSHLWHTTWTTLATNRTTDKI